jgi:hypothetical protein
MTMENQMQFTFSDTIAGYLTDFDADFLASTAGTIENHFQDYDDSPFVQEKFHEDWSHDKTWGWQQNRDGWHGSPDGS